MNKALALAAFLCLNFITIIAVKAQTEKGKQTLGLEFSFSTGKGTGSSRNLETNEWGPESTNKTTSFSLSPSYSYFIADKLDISTSLSYGRSTSKNEDGTSGYNSKTISKSLIAGVSVRKYLLFENKIGVRVGPYFNYSFSNREYDYVDSPNVEEERIKSYSGGIGLDFVYYPTTRLGLAAKLGNISYTHNNNKNQYTKEDTDQFNLNFANSLSLSLFYTFGGKN